MRQRHLPAADEGGVGGGGRVPLLPQDPKRDTGGQEVRLREVDACAAIERRPPEVGFGRPAAAKKIEAPVLGVDARLFLGPVTDAERDPLRLAFGYRDSCGHVGQLIGRPGRADGGHRTVGVRPAALFRGEVGARRARRRRPDRHELKQLRGKQAALRFLEDAASVELTLLVRQPASNDVFADAFVAAHLHGAEVRQPAGLGFECQPRRFAIGAVVLLHGDRCIRIAAVAELVARPFMRGEHQLAIARLAGHERALLFQRGEARGRQHLEADEIDARDEHRRSFRHRDRDVYRVPLAIGMYVVPGHTRGVVAAIGVEGVDALHVRLEARAIEVRFLAPRNLRVDVRCQHTLERRLVDVLHALELQ